MLDPIIRLNVWYDGLDERHGVLRLMLCLIPLAAFATLMSWTTAPDANTFVGFAGLVVLAGLRLAYVFASPERRAAMRWSMANPTCPRVESPKIRELIDALGSDARALSRVGSRETCDPAPVGTDEDWLLLTRTDPEATLRALGFGQDGHPEFYTGNDAGGFRSWRFGDVNVITTEDPVFHDRFMAATHLAKRFNLLDKGDRIALFQAVLYGVSAGNLEGSFRSRTRAAKPKRLATLR